MVDGPSENLELWIQSVNGESDRAQLEELGIQVGNWNGERFENCQVSEAAMDKLDPLWLAPFIWGPMNPDESR